MHDGSIIFSTALDNTQLEKDLAGLTKKIEKQEQKIAELSSKRDKAREKGLFDAETLDREKAKLQEIKDRLADIRAMAKDKGQSQGQRENYAAHIPAVQQEMKDQQMRVNALQAEWNKTQNAAERYAAQLSEAEGILARQKAEAGDLVRQIEEANGGAARMARAADRAEARMAQLAQRMKGILASAFIFNIVSAGLRQFTVWIGKSIKANSEARQSIAQLKGALLTLAQPLVEVIIPAFTMLVNVLARVVAAAAQLVSMLFGKTLKQSKDGAKALYEEAGGIEAVGGAAKEAMGSLAGFDEINTINTENAGGAGGGGGASADIAPDFSWADDMGGMLDRLKEIADLVGLIAAGLALWKLSGMLPGVLGAIAQKLAGILLTVGGLLLYWDGLTDAWENGVDWLNLIEMIGGLAAAALGLYLLFGPIAAGIALIVGGIGMLVTAFHDAMKNGWNLQNTLLAIAGLLAAGLGIAMLTGSWIPLLIAGIASLLLALTVATGHGEELLDGIRTMMEGFAEFFTGIFTGDIEKAVGGIEKIFGGLKTAVFAVVNGVKDSLLSFLDWLDEKTDGRFHGIIEIAKGFVIGFFDSVNATLGDVLDAVKQIFTGITKFISGVFTNDWDMAWEGIKDIFKGAWNGIVSLLEGAVNLIIKGLNWLISQMNKISFTVPSWVPEWGGKSIGINIPSIPEAKIPRLAKGAVIPPNREFMAVLGDQRSGNNLEAPEDLIRKIVREESGGGSAELIQLLQAILSAVKSGHVIMVDGSVFGRTAIRTINGVTTSAGKQLLLI